MTTDPHLFQRKVSCPACKQNFSTTSILSSKVRRKKTHSDFYTEYNGVNPNYYLIYVCPHCGYAYFKNSSPLNPTGKEIIKEKITKNWASRDFGGKRDLQTAIETFKLAFLCGQLIGERDNVLAGILMHLVWLYREVGDRESEERFMKLARDYYLKVYNSATFDVDVARTLYLIAELYRGLGEYQDALVWYRHIIDDKKINDATIIRLAREQYTETRELQKKQRKAN